MPTESSSDMLGFSRVERRLLVAAFDGGRLTSDAGALLLGAADRAIGLIDRFAACFEDGRAPGQVIHVRSYAVIAVYSAVLMNRISPPGCPNTDAKSLLHVLVTAWTKVINLEHPGSHIISR